MRLTSSGAYARPTPTPKMPPGLIELMEGLTKDVLKNNPDDVYEFCAGHMQKLLNIRDAVPKKQMSLDEKIKKAQEKIRQRIKERQLQYQKEMSELSNETQENMKNVAVIKNQAVIDTPVDRPSSSKPPVHHGDVIVKSNEVEIFHEPDVIITTTDILEDEAHGKQKEVEDCLPVNTAETTQNDILTASVDEQVKESSADDKAYIPISPQTQLADQVKIDAEECIVNTEVDTAPLEAVQTETSINYVNKKLTDKMVEIEPITSDTLQSEESTHPVEEKKKEKTDDNDTKLITELKQVDCEPEKTSHVSGITNTEGMEETRHNDLPTNSDEILKPSDSNFDTVESKDETKAVVKDVEEIIKHELEEKMIIPVQDVQENNESVKEINENVSSEIDNKVSQIDKAIEENVIDQDYNKDVLKLIENNTVVLTENESDSNKVNCDDEMVLNESKKEVEKINNECLPQPSSLDNIASGEKESGSIDPEPLTETVKFVKENESHPMTSLENQENSIDQVAESVHNISQVDVDTDKLTDAKHHISTELFRNENDTTIHNKAPGNKNDKIENDESADNAEGSGMDLETAAITIQKVFRTFLFSKSRTSTLDDTVNENSLDEEIEKKDEPEYVISSANLNKERRTLGISRMDTMLQTVNEEKSLSLSTDDSSTLSSAATTIQAHVRGFLVRNRLASYKTGSNSSLVNSEGPSTTSLDGDTNEPKKTILNIHIVPERGHFMSRDESMLTSIDLPLDNTPPSSINLHPLGYDKSEPRKQLKREDAIQSVSPPSNNSGKLSEEVDSVKDSLELKPEENLTNSLTSNDKRQDVDTESCDTTLTISSTADTVVDAETYNARDVLSSPEHNSEGEIKNEEAATNLSSDEMDVVTPFPTAIEKTPQDSDEKPKLVHSGEFHDIVVQTQVKRSESSVVREFKNVLVYFLLWDKT